jgi:transposase
VLAQGWGELRRQLAYKCERARGRLVEVPAPYTSQTCSTRGAVDPASRDGKRFACLTCGHRADADGNAALTILAAGQAVARGEPSRSVGATNRELPVPSWPMRPESERESPAFLRGAEVNGAWCSTGN